MLAKLAAVLCVLVLWSAPAQALTQDEATAIAEWAGYPGLVLVDHDVEDPNGAFGLVFGFIPVILLDQPEGFPDVWAVLILLHEVGHYYQWADGYSDSLAPVDSEWQADLWGARAGCAFGIPVREFHDLWLYMIALYGDEPSESHGRTSDRIVYTMSLVGSECWPSAESPWVQAWTITTTGLATVASSR